MVKAGYSTNRVSIRDKIYARYNNQRRTPETYRRQDDVFVWVRNIAFTVWKATSFRIRITSYKEDYLVYYPTNKLVKVCIAMHLRSLRYPINFSLQHYVAIALASWRGAVTRLSIHD